MNENQSSPMLRKLDAIIQRIRNDILANQDLRTKEIGDRVKVWDNSSFSDEYGNEMFIVHEPIRSIEYFIVIETGLKVKLKPRKFEYTQDLLLVNPKTNLKYRANSQHVKIL